MNLPPEVEAYLAKAHHASEVAWKLQTGGELADAAGKEWMGCSFRCERRNLLASLGWNGSNRVKFVTLHLGIKKRPGGRKDFCDKLQIHLHSLVQEKRPS